MTKSSVTCSYPIAVVIPLCSDSAWKRRGNSPRPYYLPLVWRHANGYLHEVFSSCGSNSPAERVSPRGESEGRVAVKIGGGGGLLCFTSEEQQGEKKKKRPESEDKVSDSESRGKIDKKSRFSRIGKWSYPPRESTSLRWRASRRSAAERFVTRAPKDIFTHMHTERGASFSLRMLYPPLIKWCLRWRCIAECILLRKVTLRSLCRFSPFTGEGWVSGQVARMVSKVSPLI